MPAARSAERKTWRTHVSAARGLVSALVPPRLDDASVEAHLIPAKAELRTSVESGTECEEHLRPFIGWRRRQPFLLVVCQLAGAVCPLVEEEAVADRVCRQNAAVGVRLLLLRRGCR